LAAALVLLFLGVDLRGWLVLSMGLLQGAPREGFEKGEGGYRRWTKLGEKAHPWGHAHVRF